VNDFNPGNDEPSNSTSLNSKKGLIIASLVMLAILGSALVFYLTRNTPGEVELAPTPSLAATATPLPLPIVSNSVDAPISPLSPVSPVTESTSALPDMAAVDTLFEKGLEYYEANEYDQALKAFNDILALEPQSARALDARGTVYTSLGNFDQAIDDYDEAIKADPLYPPPYYNRGRLYGLQKKYDAAIVDLQKSIDLAPLFFGYRANGNIGLIYHQQGNYEKALEAFTAAISANDSKADSYYLRGETYTSMENYEAAISDYQAAISRFPNYYQAYQSEGYAYYKTGQFDQAIEALNKAIELSPDSPTAHLYLSLVYLATDQADKAQAEVSQAMKGIGALAEEDQNLLYQRVLADLEIFAKENPEKAKDVETLTNLIPQPQ
jgi:tetratricopeptide (TPR) repeat protein